MRGLRYCSARPEFRLESIGAPVACFVENTFLTFMNHKSVLREQPVWVTRVLGNGRDTAGYKRAFIIREAVTLVLSIPTISFFFFFSSFLSLGLATLAQSYYHP